MDINMNRIGSIWVVGILIISMLINVGFAASDTKASAAKYVDVTYEIIDKSFDGTPPTALKEAKTISKSPTQTEKIIVILIEFNDTKHNLAHDQAYYNSLIFSQTVGANSMYNYYKENSYGQLAITGEVTAVWYTATHNESYYGSNEFGSYPGNAQGLTREAVEAADASINFSQYDNDNNGIVDHIIIIHAGNDEAQTGNTTNIKSHHWALGSNYYTTGEGKIVNNYMMIAETSPLGTPCHEFGHDLNLPDLYDTDYTSQGVGNWGLMGSGNWLNSGNTPAHLCAWSKVYLGWIKPVNLTIEGYYTINPVENYIQIKGEKA